MFYAGVPSACLSYVEQGIIALGRTSFNVLEKNVATASHGDNHPVHIALQDVVGNLDVQRLRRGQSVTAFDVDVDSWRTIGVRYHWVSSTTIQQQTEYLSNIWSKILTFTSRLPFVAYACYILQPGVRGRTLRYGARGLRHAARAQHT